MITVIHGPAASGKTRRAEKLREHFNCSTIVEDWSPHFRTNRGRSIPVDALIITCEHPDTIRKYFGNARLVSIENAKLALEGEQRGLTDLGSAVSYPGMDGYVSIPDGVGDAIEWFLHPGLRLAAAAPAWANGSVILHMLGGLRPDPSFEEEGTTALLTRTALRQIGQDLIAFADAKATGQ